MVLVVVLICGFLVVQFGFDGFFLLWVLGLWVLFAALSSTSLSSSHVEASLSQVLFSFCCCCCFFFFLGGYGVDFWMDVDYGGSGLAMGLGLLLNVDG